MVASRGVFDFMIGNPVMIRVICLWYLPPRPHIPISPRLLFSRRGTDLWGVVDGVR